MVRLHDSRLNHRISTKLVSNLDHEFEFTLSPKKDHRNQLKIRCSATCSPSPGWTPLPHIFLLLQSIRNLSRTYYHCYHASCCYSTHLTVWWFVTHTHTHTHTQVHFIHSFFSRRESYLSTIIYILIEAAAPPRLHCNHLTSSHRSIAVSWRSSSLLRWHQHN